MKSGSVLFLRGQSFDNCRWREHKLYFVEIVISIFWGRCVYSRLSELNGVLSGSKIGWGTGEGAFFFLILNRGFDIIDPKALPPVYYDNMLVSEDGIGGSSCFWSRDLVAFLFFCY